MPITVDPRHCALLVMDYQNGIIDSLDDAEGLLSKASDAIALVRGRGGKIGHVRVAFTDADYDALPATSPMAAHVPASRREALHIDSPNTAIHDQVAPEPGDIVVRKSRVGAFSTTDLDSRLREAGITTLILAGVATSGVILSTVRDAADRDYRLIVLADACADRSAAVHDFLIEQILPRQAHVTTTSELDTLLS